MNPEVLQYILDFVNHDFIQFSQSPIAIRAIERNLEIVGEAVKKLKELEIDFENNSKIIGLRNIIAHAYDSVDRPLLWNIISRHIPNLKIEIHNLRN